MSSSSRYCSGQFVLPPVPNSFSPDAVCIWRKIGRQSHAACRVVKALAYRYTARAIPPCIQRNLANRFCFPPAPKCTLRATPRSRGEGPVSMLPGWSSTSITSAFLFLFCALCLLCGESSSCPLRGWASSGPARSLSQAAEAVRKNRLKRGAPGSIIPVCLALSFSRRSHRSGRR